MMDKIRCILFLMIIVIGLSGCSSVSPIPNQTVSTNSSTPEYSPAVILTATLLPGLHRPPSPEYPRPVTPRVTPFPTKTRAEVRDELDHILRTNGDCALPCLWGIYPEQTTYEELYSLIDNLGGLRFETLQANGHLSVASHFSFEERSGIFVEFQADLQDDIVQDLKVLLLNLQDTGITQDDWAAYTMSEILRTYGVPDRVELYLSGPYNSLSFHARLKYESINTSVIYYARTTQVDRYQTPSTVIFCPAEIGIDMVELHLGKHPFNDIPADGVPLSKATGLDEQAFHKLFTEDPSACLTLDRGAMQ